MKKPKSLGGDFGAILYCLKDMILFYVGGILQVRYCAGDFYYSMVGAGG